MRVASRIISVLFHPLIMPTLGLLLILNSGTYLALLDPAAKQAILLVMGLGTLVFPLMIIPVLYYRKMIYSGSPSIREERWVPMVIVLVLFVITFIYFVRLPLNRVIHGFALSICVVLALLILFNLRYRMSGHMAALGGLSGLVLALMLLYETPMEAALVLTILSAGLTGTARMVLGDGKPWHLLTGYLGGLGTVLFTLLLY